MGDFRSQSVLAKRNVDALNIQLSSFLGRNAGNKANLEMIFRKIRDGFEILNEQNKVGGEGKRVNK